MIDKLNIKHIAIALIIALIGSVSIHINIVIEEKIEVRHQEGIQEGRDEVYSEIADDLDTFGAYRLPITQPDGATTSMWLVPPQNIQKSQE